ncbi:hypothetical protein LCGC14_0912510 [marine sediment metagenome]|uniref:Uncharacterized protein n=1 Tax=marine sediment metagenome TaxID=412755 RepID=A0A0F9PDZ2_9ZZZZ
MVRFTLIVVEKFRKGTTARRLGTFATRTKAEQIRSEKKFVGRRGTPFIVPESEAAAFIASRKTGIFAPKFVPPTQAELKRAAERKKSQERFERRREQAKLPTREGGIARQILFSEFGIRAEAAAAQLILTKAQLKREKAIERFRRISRTAGKIDIQREAFTLTTGGVPLTLLGQPGKLIFEEKIEDFPTGFIPKRPIAPGETMILEGPQIDFLGERRFGTGATIGAAPTRAELRQQTRELSLFPAEAQLLFRKTREEIKEQEKLIRALGAGGAAAFGAELTLTGGPKAIEAIPEALAFGALTFVSPPAAALVGTIALGFSIPGLQEEIREKGLLRASASELPTIAVFTAAGGAGARLRTTGVVRGAKSDIKFEQLLEKDIDPSFTFDAKPFAIVSKGKAPKFLQRSLTGKIITPGKLEFLLKDVGAGADVVKPTTIKELRILLGQAERVSLTREQAGQLDIFKPEIEEFLLAEPGRKGLITPGKLGIKTRQLQLRETFPTVAQKGAFVLAQLPRISRPTKQLTLFPSGKKGQLLFQQQFDIGEIFRGAGEGLRRFGELGPELPRVAGAEARAGRLGFIPSISTGLFSGVDTDLIVSQRTQLIQESLFEPIQIPISKQKFKSKSILDVDILQDQLLEFKQKQAVDVDILQDQKLELTTLQDILQEPVLRQRAKKQPALFEPPPEKQRKIKGAIFGFGEMPGFAETKAGFDVIIREKGQDLKANTKSLPRNRALNFGADIIDNSAAASFRIRKSKKAADVGFDDGFFFLKNKFRSPATKSKLPPKQFIEKNLFRIDSAGERAGITAKGLIARRKKAMKNQALDFDFGFAGGIGL